MKKLLIVLILLLLPVSGWGATYYCAKVEGTWRVASGDWPTGESDACTDINGALTAAGTGNTLVIASGTYQTTDLDATDGLDSVASGMTVRGPVSSTDYRLLALGYTADPAHATYNNGATIIDGTGLSDHVFVYNHATGTVANLTIQYAPAGKRIFTAYTNGPLLVKDCVFIYDKTTAIDTAAFVNDITATITRCEFRGYYRLGTYFVLSFDHADCNVLISFCKFIDVSRGIEVKKGTVRICNCIFDDIDSNNLYVYNNSETKAISATNCVFTANNDTGNPIRNSSAANETFTLSNNIIQANAYSPGTYTGITGSYTDGGGNITHTIPMWKTSRYPSILVCSIDDTVDADSAQTMAGVVESYGGKMTWNVNTSAMTSGDWIIANDLVSRGHEIASHTRHHANIKDLEAFDIQYTGGACTMTINVGSDTLTTSVGGSWTLSNYADITNLAAAINGTENYTCTVNATEYAGDGVPSSLADVSAQDINTSSYTAYYDETRHFLEEITNSKADIEANIPGYTCTTFVPPGHYYDEAAVTAIYNAGYTGMRDGGTGTGDYLMYDAGGIDLLNLTGIPCNTFAEHGSVSAWGSARLTEMCCQGRLIEVYDHSFLEFTSTDLSMLLALAKKTDMRLMSRADAVAWIKSVGVDSGDHRTYTLTHTPNPDYSLRTFSPCINAGTNPFSDGDGDQYDYAGNLVWRDSDDKAVGAWSDGVEIGPYGWFGGILLQ